MIYIRFRDDPRDDAEVAEFQDDEYPEALAELERVKVDWKEAWMYLETNDMPDPEGLINDWVMLWDNTNWP